MATVRQASSTSRSLNAGRENCLELRVLFFARNHAHFNFAEGGVFQQFVQFHFAEAEPAVGVKFARFLEAMTEQIENDNAPVFFQNAMRGADSALRLNRI